MSAATEKILALAKEAVENPKWKAGDGKTYCNIAMDFIATGMGCNDFRDTSGNVLLADGIYEKVSKSDLWRTVTIGGTWKLANEGALVFAIANSKTLMADHGHISLIIPGWPTFSGHWNKTVPMCANVGRDNFMDKGVNFAFRKEPEFFVWKQSVPEKGPDESPVTGGVA